MAVFWYKCKCGASLRKLLEKAVPQVCSSCGKKMARSPRPVTTKTNEVLDNGLMVNRVERLVNAEEIYKERSRRDSEEHATEIPVVL
jgi:DNA-directed RNA polymerase subunit RPC12/RpoP